MRPDAFDRPSLVAFFGQGSAHKSIQGLSHHDKPCLLHQSLEDLYGAGALSEENDAQVANDTDAAH